MTKKNIFTYVMAIVLIAFALLTLFLSSAVIFDWFGIRAEQGNYVLFIVWANFICSILYLLSAFGVLKNSKWSLKSMSIALAILIIALITLFIHITIGGLYEIKTVGAILFRTIVTLVFTALLYLKFKE